jgi:hypothetical protein
MRKSGMAGSLDRAKKQEARSKKQEARSKKNSDRCDLSSSGF